MQRSMNYCLQFNQKKNLRNKRIISEDAACLYVLLGSTNFPGNPESSYRKHKAETFSHECLYEYTVNYRNSKCWKCWVSRMKNRVVGLY